MNRVDQFIADNFNCFETLTIIVADNFNCFATFALTLLIIIVSIVILRNTILDWRYRKSATLRYINYYRFSEGLIQRFSRKYPEYSAQQIRGIFDTLKEFFKLAVLAEGKMVAMPSKIVDEAWHEFILFTRDYHHFSNNVFGKYFHHTPFEGATNPEKARSATQLIQQLRESLAKVDTSAKVAGVVSLELWSIDQQLNVAPSGWHDMGGDNQDGGCGGGGDFGGACGGDGGCGGGCGGGGD